MHLLLFYVSLGAEVNGYSADSLNLSLTYLLLGKTVYHTASKDLKKHQGQYSFLKIADTSVRYTTFPRRIRRFDI
jgi:hypothetical protein